MKKRSLPQAPQSFIIFWKQEVPMFIITGGAGFIGSALVWKLNSIGISDILVVDNLGSSDKWMNISNLSFTDYINKHQFRKLLNKGGLPDKIEGILHMGACSATTEKNAEYLMDNNYRYTAELAEWCINQNIRFIYASSAATYGDGTKGFSDAHEKLHELRPLNPYGYSKHLFDLYALKHGLLDRITGLKFFNVFGPNEYHKGEMRSVVHKFFPVVRSGKPVHLFKSHKEGIADGMQQRDFVYIKDVVDTVIFFLENGNTNGIFNIGTGTATSFKELITSMYCALGKKPKIRYKKMPESLQSRYQYYTCAEIEKLRDAGYGKKFTCCKDAVYNYINAHLIQDNPFIKTQPEYL